MGKDGIATLTLVISKSTGHCFAKKTTEKPFIKFHLLSNNKKQALIR